MLDLLEQPPAVRAHAGRAGLGTASPSLLEKLSLLFSPLIGKPRNFLLVSLQGGTGISSLDVLFCEQRSLAGGCQGEPTRCSLRWAGSEQRLGSPVVARQSPHARGSAELYQCDSPRADTHHMGEGRLISRGFTGDLCLSWDLAKP